MTITFSFAQDFAMELLGKQFHDHVQRRSGQLFRGRILKKQKVPFDKKG